jgi:hypothetical protein
MLSEPVVDSLAGVAAQCVSTMTNRIRSGKSGRYRDVPLRPDPTLPNVTAASSSGSGTPGTAGDVNELSSGSCS